MYSPKLNPEHVMAIYRLKRVQEEPMTRILSNILEKALMQKGGNGVCKKCKEDGNNNSCSNCPFNHNGKR